MFEKIAGLLKIRPERLKEELHTFLFITLGIAVYCAVTVFFVKPAQLATGGVMGICLFLNYVFGTPIGLTNLTLNVILFAFAYKFLPRRFFWWTLYSVLLISLLLQVFDIFPKPYMDDKMLIIVVVGVLDALALATVFSVGGSSGGFDIISMAARRKWGIELGNTSMYINFAVLLLFLFIVPFQNVVYGFLMSYIYSLVLNGDLRAFAQRREVMIITNQTELVRNYIVYTLHRGVTIFKARGGWDHSERDVIVSILGHRQEVQLKLFLKKHDPKAFMRLSTAQEVHGKGFEAWENEDDG